MKIILGAFDFSDQLETGRIICDIVRATMHDDWNPSILEFDGDIAMLELTKDVNFNEFIQPICLVDESLLNINDGVVVGWGLINATVLPDIPRKLEIPIVTNVQCLRKDRGLVRVIWDESFCAGRSNTSVCAGDSGSGFYIEKDGVFYLRGIVSSSTLNKCDGRNFAIYSDVFKYTSFINGVSCDIN